MVKEVDQLLRSWLYSINVYSINDEWFRTRKVLKDGVVAGNDSRWVLHRATQFETDTAVTSFANGKPVAFKERGLMHQAMRLVHYPVNPAFRYKFSGLMLGSQPSFPYMQIWSLATD